MIIVLPRLGTEALSRTKKKTKTKTVIYFTESPNRK